MTIKPLTQHENLCQFYLTGYCACNIICKAYSQGYQDAIDDMDDW